MTAVAPRRVARTEFGLRLAGFVYGTIIALSTIVAGARIYPHDPTSILALVATTCAVFWTAHVYSHAIGESIAHQERISWAELRLLARREASIIEAAVPPVAALLLGAIGLLRESVAIWLAFGVGLVVLGVQGLVVARLERLGPVSTVAVMAANLALGIFVVGLKLLLTH
jgi:hypothetical protein